MNVSNVISECLNESQESYAVKRLAERYPTMESLFAAEESGMLELKIGKNRARLIVRASRFYKAIETEKAALHGKISCPRDAYLLLKGDLELCDQEHLVVLGLNGANEVIVNKTITLGLADRSLCHPREIFKPIIAAGAAGLVLAHNHPSNQLFPSDEDRKITKRISDAGETLGINLIDHVIITRNGYYSFKEHGEI